jgi:hypothetical protein
MFETGREPGSRLARNLRAGLGGWLRQAVRRLLGRAELGVTFIQPPRDEPDDDDFAGSGVPRRPPDQFGSGAVALAEPRSEKTGPDEQIGPYTRPG